MSDTIFPLRPTPPSERIVFLDVLRGFALQMIFSHWWLQRFPQGPMEKLWRSWTYGR